MSTTEFHTLMSVCLTKNWEKFSGGIEASKSTKLDNLIPSASLGTTLKNSPVSTNRLISKINHDVGLQINGLVSIWKGRVPGNYRFFAELITMYCFCKPGYMIIFDHLLMTLFKWHLKAHSPSETIFGNWKPFKNDEKCFSFHL